MTALSVFAVSDAFRQSGGKPYGEIVIAADAPSSVRLAAKELAGFIRQSCGAELKICDNGYGNTTEPKIFIGGSPGLKKHNITAGNLKSDGFRIVARPGFFAIIGRDYSGPPLIGFRDPWDRCTVFNSKMNLGAFGECGSLFGVYYFLQKYCGIRWYMPGPLGTVVPPKKAVLVPELDISVNPDFEYRFPRYCLFQRDPEGALWFKRLRLGGPAPVQINHSFQFFKHYAKTHPEYFALVDGKRDIAGGKCCVGHGHLCLSNPAVVKLWIDTICKYFKDNPEQLIYPVVPGDALNRICECPKCAAEVNHKANPDTGIFSNHIFGFVNKVAAGVAKKYPGKYIGCAAYKKYSDPPDNPKEMQPNVVVMLCKRRSSFLNDAYKKNVRARIEAWRKTVGSRLYFWDYYLDTDLPWRNLPVQFTGLISEDLRYLKKIGSKGEFVENPLEKGRIGYPGMQHINLYVTSQLYWNCHADVNRMLDEYFKLFYGPAESEMREFWLSAEKRRNEVGAKYLKAGLGSIRNDLSPSVVYPTSVLNRFTALLETALKKTPKTSVYHKRVKLIYKEFAKGAASIRSIMRTQIPEITLVRSNSATDRYTAKPQEFAAKTGEATTVKSWLYAGYDNTTLYFKLIAFEPQMDKLRTKAEKTDQGAVWNDDGVEIFICPDPARPNKYFQFFISAQGTVWDANHGIIDATSLNTAYNSNCKVTASKGKNRWSIEIAIPFKALGLDGGALAGKSISANFYRYRNQAISRNGEQLSCWSPTGQFIHFYPAKFGIIKFRN
ncbi:MAG: DUF4838 domain-containing protein [Victivallales bacterium]